MAFKRGFCTHCHGEEKNRIFDVNKEADVCYCPNCTAAMKPKEAISNYIWLISSYLKKASKALFETTEYLYAYQTFAHIIDLDDSVKVAYFGRLLSLVYLSTLRKSKISFALLMHRQQAKLFHYQENAREYFHFLWLLDDALEKYESRLKKRVMSHGIFYDIECAIVYLKRLDEIRAYKEFIISESKFFVENNKEQFNSLIGRIEKTLQHYDDVLEETYVTADGYSYRFVTFNKSGVPLINLQTNVVPRVISHMKPASLNPKDDKKSPIKDEIYQNNLPMSRFVAASIPFAIFLLVCVIAAMVTSLFIDDKIIKLILYASSAAVLLLSLVLFILHFSWKGRLRKKYYNGTNPFIFK